MTRVILVVCLFIFSLSLLLSCGSGGAGQAPTSASMAQTIGWAVGGPADGYGMILHTTDGGQNWERQGTSIDIPNVALNGVSTVNANEAWAVGAPDPESGYAVILHTRDGGLTWTREEPADDLSGLTLIAVSAVSGNIAWAVGYIAQNNVATQGVILCTSNGGGLWERQGVSQAPNVELAGVYASDPLHVWVVGYNEPGNDYGTILRTTDGGTTWEKVPYTLSRSVFSPYLLTVNGANANQVWAVGRGQLVHIAVTSQGISVTDQTPTFGAGYDINGVYALDERTIWAVADGPVIWRSDDGGTTWNSQPPPPPPPGSQYAFRVCAIDESHAWATALGVIPTLAGFVWSTSDGGTTWAAQQIPATPNMWGISFLRNQESY